jgi:hypothetical protein
VEGDIEPSTRPVPFAGASRDAAVGLQALCEIAELIQMPPVERAKAYRPQQSGYAAQGPFFGSLWCDTSAKLLPK